MSEEGSIYYTIDNSTPSSDSNLYIDPISITNSTTLKFIAYDLAGNNSPVYSESYIIDTIVPVISVIDPKNGATNVASSKTINVTFNEAIKAGSNFWIELINSSQEAIPFTTSIDGNILTITPTNDLTEDRYKLILHTGCVTDLAGNLLASKSIYFSVGTSPTITSTNPTNGATNLATDKVITITFSEDVVMKKGWIELVNKTKGTAVDFTSTINGNVLTITPTNALTEALYKVMVHTGSVTDRAGNLVAGKSFYFSVGTSPTITSTSPLDGATNVHVAKTITVTFSETIKKSRNFWIEVVDSTGNAVAYNSYITSGNILVIDPMDNLAANTTYKVKLHTGCVNDLAGNLVAPYIFSFTTKNT
ncbi:MAG: Ig-like domain-containing protein [Methanothermobacter sp.]